MLKTTTICLTILFFTAPPGYADGIADLKENEIALKSVEALKSLQSEFKTAIDSQIGEAKCNDDNQCKAIPIGANPCGGPETYQAYSVLDTDVDRLKRLAEQYKSVRKTLHLKTGTMGACIMMPAPDVKCKNLHCVTTPKPGTVIF